MLDIVLEDLRQKDGTEDQKQAAMNALFNLWNPREPESRQRALHWLTIQDLHQKQTVSSEQPRPDNEEIVESAEEDIAGGEESDFEGFGEVSEGENDGWEDEQEEQDEQIEISYQEKSWTEKLLCTCHLVRPCSRLRAY